MAGKDLPEEKDNEISTVLILIRTQELCFTQGVSPWPTG